MRRREFITLLGGTAATWPLVARAQSQERVRRIAMLIALGADNADAQAYRAAFLQVLQQLGWTDGHNVRIETRWGGGSRLRDSQTSRRSSRASAGRHLYTWHCDHVAAFGGDTHRADRVCGGHRPGRRRLRR